MAPNLTGTRLRSRHPLAIKKCHPGLVDAKRNTRGTNHPAQHRHSAHIAEYFCGRRVDPMRAWMMATVFICRKAYRLLGESRDEFAISRAYPRRAQYRGKSLSAPYGREPLASRAAEAQSRAG